MAREISVRELRNHTADVIGAVTSVVTQDSDFGRFADVEVIRV